MPRMGINNLDLRTIVFATVFIYSILALLMSLAWFIHKQEKSLFFWAAASAAGAAGMCLIGLRGTIFPYLSLTVGNVLCVSSLIIMWLGNCTYTAGEIKKNTIFRGIVAIFLIWIVIGLVHKDNVLRVAVTCACAAIASFLCGGSLLYRMPKYLHCVQLPAGMIMIAWGMFWAYRSIASFRLVDDIFSPTLYQTASFIIAFIAPLSWTIAQIVMISYRHVFAAHQHMVNYNWPERACC
jgi:hypothetical protein